MLTRLLLSRRFQGLLIPTNDYLPALSDTFPSYPYYEINYIYFPHAQWHLCRPLCSSNASVIILFRYPFRVVFREKSPEAIKAFGRLVSKTLEDINERGTEVDSLLKYKLADMADDTAALARAAQERREQKAATEDTGA